MRTEENDSPTDSSTRLLPTISVFIRRRLPTKSQKETDIFLANEASAKQPDVSEKSDMDLDTSETDMSWRSSPTQLWEEDMSEVWS